MTRETLGTDVEWRTLSARLQAANAEVARRWPGEPLRRQAVHTVYGGAQLFKHDTAHKLSAQALRALEVYAPDADSLARVLGLDTRTTDDAGRSVAQRIHARVVEKLRREAVEDFRIDFEDGYGNRSDAEEDGHAESCARELARGMSLNTLPAFIGIRVKTFSDERLKERAVRTTDILLETLLRETGGRLPPNFVICLPKIRHREHVAVMADFLELLERRHRLAAGALVFEIMIETTQSIFDEHGRSQMPQLLEAARGRCVAAHFGTYDYTASCNVTAAWQKMNHPACLLALQMMQVSYAGSGLQLSDGSTNILPVGPHAARAGAPSLTANQLKENQRTVHRAWKLHFDDVQHSLGLGFYQGWDLHPAQLVSRYAALYDFFLQGLAPAAERLSNFVSKVGTATLVGDVFDDAATGQGLLNFFLRALNCGAITDDEALALSGLTADELRTRSFVTILTRRRGAGSE